MTEALVANPSHTLHAVLMLQPQCNMHCSFCITEDSMSVMPPDLARQLLRFLRERGYSSAIFGGGEPFHWPHDPAKLIQFAKELGFLTQVGTNAVNLPEGFEQWSFIDRWVLPLDGTTGTTHNSMRHYHRRHREIILSALKKLAAAEKSVTISTVITKINQGEILGIGEWLRSIVQQQPDFVHAWHLYQFLPFGRGGAVHKEELEIPPEAYEDLVLKAKAANLPFRVFKRANMMNSKTVHFFWFEGGRLQSNQSARILSKNTRTEV